MSREWYVQVRGKSHGPFSDAQMVSLAGQGKFKPTDHVRVGEHGNWVPAAKIRGIFGEHPQTIPHAETTRSTASQPTAANSTAQDAGEPTGNGRFAIVMVALVAACIVIPFVSYLAVRIASRPEPTVVFRPIAPEAPIENPQPVPSNAKASELKSQRIEDAQPTTPPQLDVKANKPALPVAATSNGVMSGREIASLLKRSVVKLRRPDGIEGSGFVVSKDGVVVTNFHVIDGAESMVACFEDGRKLSVFGYLAASEGKDLVLLKIQADPGLAPLAIESTNPDTGETTFTYGAPKGLDYSLSSGLVSAVRVGIQVSPIHDIDATWIQTTTPVSHGNSGGPLVNEHGKVVGVISWGIEEGQNLNFAVAARHISELLQDTKSTPTRLADLPPSKSRKAAELRVAQQKHLERQMYEAEMARRAQAQLDTARQQHQLAQQQLAQEEELARQATARETARGYQQVGPPQQYGPPQYGPPQLGGMQPGVTGDASAELDRINQRALQVRQELKSAQDDFQNLSIALQRIEAKGNSLIQQRNLIEQNGNGIQQQIQDANNRGVAAAYNGGDTQQAQFEIAQLQRQYQVLQGQYNQLTIAINQIQSQYQSCQQQLQITVNRGNQAQSELADLAQQYRALGGTP